MNLRPLLYAALVLLALVRLDFWQWNDARHVLGLPIGLTYHLIFCLVLAGVLGLLVRHAWPHHLAESADGDEPAEGAS